MTFEHEITKLQLRLTQHCLETPLEPCWGLDDLHETQMRASSGLRLRKGEIHSPLKVKIEQSHSVQGPK